MICPPIVDFLTFQVIGTLFRQTGNLLSPFSYIRPFAAEYPKARRWNQRRICRKPWNWFLVNEVA